MKKILLGLLVLNGANALAGTSRVICATAPNAPAATARINQQIEVAQAEGFTSVSAPGVSVVIQPVYTQTICVTVTQR